MLQRVRELAVQYKNGALSSTDRAAIQSEVNMLASEVERIGVTDPTQADVYVTVRSGEAIEDFRANLRAPILISGGRGHQVINEAKDTSVRAPLFAEVPAAEAEAVA